MATAKRADLPQLGAPLFLTDGGLETTLVFRFGLDLPDFAAFPLLETPEGRNALERYLSPYFDVAERDGVGIIVDTPTWRANPDWAARRGYDVAGTAEVNARAVAFIREFAAGRPGVVTVVSGAIGPRGDGYVVDATMDPADAADYHDVQIRALADAGVDFVTALTMTHVEEAIGISQAARFRSVPCVVSFTVETDGRLPSGTSLADAIRAVDEATDNFPAYYMLNCAHPSHFTSTLADDGPWRQRLKGIRANASRMSHAELDAAVEVDRGDPLALASDYQALRLMLPGLTIFGGCCGTDHEHIGAIAAALMRS